MAVPSIATETAATVEVLPASTTVATWDTRWEDYLTVQVDNLEGAQTFAGTIQRRLSEDMEWATSTIGDFANIPAGQSVVADLDVRGTRWVRLVGTMDGAGGNVRVLVTRRSSWIGSRRP